MKFPGTPKNPKHSLKRRTKLEVSHFLISRLITKLQLSKQCGLLYWHKDRHINQRDRTAVQT
jgi:hypothetical protein